MRCLSQDVVDVEDIITQINDCIHPAIEGELTLKDFTHPHRIRISGFVCNILFNLNRFLAFEQRDPFSIRAQHDEPDLTDWDRYAAYEYARLASQEEERELLESSEGGGVNGWEEYDEGKSSREAPFLI